MLGIGTRRKTDRYQIAEGDTVIDISVVRSKRRSIGMEMKAADTAIVRIPNRLTNAELLAFLEKHRGWLLEKSQLMAEREWKSERLDAPAYAELTKAELDAIKRAFAAKVDFWKIRMQVTAGRITIRDQKTRWGSCSEKGNLNFNYHLYYMPEELMDYVVIHELAHRKYMDHSAAFWREVGQYCPDYKECRKRLKSYRLG